MWWEFCELAWPGDLPQPVGKGWMCCPCPATAAGTGGRGGTYFQQADAQTWSVVQHGPSTLFAIAVCVLGAASESLRLYLFTTPNT